MFLVSGSLCGQLLVSPDCAFDASLVPETCLEFSPLPVWSRDSIRQANAANDMALRARR
jgi:hypothetical protein